MCPVMYMIPTSHNPPSLKKRYGYCSISSAAEEFMRCAGYLNSPTNGAVCFVALGLHAVLEVCVACAL